MRLEKQAPRMLRSAGKTLLFRLQRGGGGGRNLGPFNPETGPGPS